MSFEAVMMVTMKITGFCGLYVNYLWMLTVTLTI
jgi:hypothetical protein